MPDNRCPARPLTGTAAEAVRRAEGRTVSAAVEAAFDAFRLWHRAAGFSERTLTARMDVLRAAAAVTGDDPLAFTADGLLRYLGDAPSDGTRRCYFLHLRSWHRWLESTGRIAADPIRGLPSPKAPRYEPHPITTAQLERVLASGIRRRTRAVILLGAYQGLRVHEIAKIRGQDLDLDGRTLRVTGKGGVTATLPLHPRIVELAAQFPRRGWWFPAHDDPSRHMTGAGFTNVVAAAMRRAGVDATAHSLRHWYGTELVRSGADLRTVQTLLRHASLATTAVYVQVADESRSLAVLGLPAVSDARPLSKSARWQADRRLAERGEHVVSSFQH